MKSPCMSASNLQVTTLSLFVENHPTPWLTGPYPCVSLSFCLFSLKTIAKLVKCLIILAPNDILPTAASSTSIRISVVPPNETDGINYYNLIAFSNETMVGGCNITQNDSAEQECLIEEIEPTTNYTIVEQSCIIDNSTILRSVEDSTTFCLEGTFYLWFSI